MNTGCIPTKALVRSAEIAHLARHAERFGVSRGPVEVDLSAVMDRKDRLVGKIIERMENGIGANAKIAVLRGAARFTAPTELLVGEMPVTAKRVIVATGSRPSAPPIAGLAEAGYITSDQIVYLRRLPSRLVVIGGGALGLEFAQMFARFGSRVTVLERLPQLLPAEDADIADVVRRALVAEGLTVRTSADVREVRVENGVRVVCAVTGGVEERFEADELLVATGRAPNVEGMGLEAIGVAFDRGGVRVDTELRTAVPGVWAAGDVTGGLMFTHVAVYEGTIAAQNAVADDHYEVDYRAAPRAVFIDPEVGAVGLTEAQAREAGRKVRVGKHPYSSIGRGRVTEEMEGLIKFVVDEDSREILGLQIAGAHGGELVHAGILAMNGNLTTDAFLDSIFIHPTFMEGVQSAAEAVWSTAPPKMTH